MCGGVRVTADDGRPGQSEALFRSDDVDNTLSCVADAEVCNAEVFYVALERDGLLSGGGLFDEGLDGLEVLTGGGGDILYQSSQRMLCVMCASCTYVI